MSHAATPAGFASLSWTDRWAGWRDGVLASPGFQRWAARFPLTRPVARRRARALFDLCAGFVYSQVLAACVQLHAFEILQPDPLPADLLAQRLGLSPAAAARLVDAAVALNLLDRRAGGRVGLGKLGAAMLGTPAVAAMVRHHALLYADLRDPVALLRGTQPATALAGYWPYAGGVAADSLSGAQVAEYSALMAATQPMIAGEVRHAYRFARHRCLLDVGGGEGVFLSEIAAAAPHLRLMLFDLPPVAARAATRFAANGLAARATTHGGSFLTDALPSGADIISLVRVLHDHDDDAALAILRAARAALPHDGTLLLVEPMSGTAGAEPVGDAYFGFYLLAMGHGRPRTPAILAGMLTQSGFAAPRLLPNASPMLTRIMVAKVSKL